MVNHKRSIYYLLVASILVTLMISCGSSRPRVGYPELGVTRRFPIPAVGREAKAKPYDFSRLKEGKGLYVFSYEIKYKRSGDATDKVSDGIRIWEHDFKNSHEDTITQIGLLPTRKGKANNLSSLGNSIPENVVLLGIDDILTNRYGPEFKMKYKKGCIVYGGRVYIDATVKPIKIIIEQPFEDDIGPIKDYFKEGFEDIEIHSMPMIRYISSLYKWND